MAGKVIPIHNVRFHPPKAYAHPPIKDPTAPPKKKIAHLIDYEFLDSTRKLNVG